VRLGLHLPSQSLANSYFVKSRAILKAHQSAQKVHFDASNSGQK
jgi:hypothetical protein